MILTVPIQLRRATAAAWGLVDPVLLEGEFAVNLDDWTFKIGDGSSTWNALSSYVLPAALIWGAISGTLSDQTDLQAALDAKGTSNFSGAYADLTGVPPPPREPYISLLNAGFTGAIDYSDDTFIQKLNIDGNTATALGLGGATSLDQLILGSEAGVLTDVALSNVPALVADVPAIVASLTAAQNVDISDNPTLSGTITCTPAALASLKMNGDAAVTGLAVSYTALLYLDCNGCDISVATDIDAILAGLDAAGLNDGVVDLSGGTMAIPTGAGLTSKSNLEGKGWTVTVNT